MTDYKIYEDFTAGVVDSGKPDMVPRKGLFDAENCTLDTRGSVKTRAGTAQFGDTISGAKSILGFDVYYKYSTGVYYPLMVFDADLYREITGTWTAQSQSLGSNLQTNMLNAFDKVYINNGTNSTMIFDGASVTTDASFKKGTIMAFHENRILVAVANLVYFTNLGTATFSNSQYINVEDTVRGMLSGDDYLYIFTEHDIYRIADFSQYEGQIFGPSAMEKMPCHVGTIAHRSLVQINHFIYTLTREGVYRIEQQGQHATRISEDSEGTFTDLNQDYLTNASAVAFEDKYYVTVRETGQSYNNKILVYDTRQLHQSVFGTDESPTFLPAFMPYTYVGATLYPKAMAVIPTSTGKKRLMFGDQLTGRTFQMETGTDDNSSAIISYMEKPVLTDTRPDMIKRLMKVEFAWETLSSYNVQVAIRSDEYAAYGDINVDLTAGGGTWGTGTWGPTPSSPGVWGNESGKKTFERPNKHGYYFLVRVKNSNADEPWQLSRLGTMYRMRPRYQGIGA